MLVKPRSFGYNAETAVNNAFQAAPQQAPEVVVRKAINEFDTFASRLRSKGVKVLVFEDTSTPVKPDAVFPNNWVSFHPDGTVVLYPMFAANRRHERRADILDELKGEYTISRIIDLSQYEAENRFLEGTGSIVFDHISKTAFACVSPRTDEQLLKELCVAINYRPLLFHAYDHGGMLIYHTNVMMCISENFAVICLEAIKDSKERKKIESGLAVNGREIVPITLSQINHFAGNMLAVNGSMGPLLVMSQSAANCLSARQKTTLSSHCEILAMPIKTIETIGGGSARCMMAEVFLPEKST